MFIIIAGLWISANKEEEWMWLSVVWISVLLLIWWILLSVGKTKD